MGEKSDFQEEMKHEEFYYLQNIHSIMSSARKDRLRLREASPGKSSDGQQCGLSCGHKDLDGIILNGLLCCNAEH